MVTLFGTLSYGDQGAQKQTNDNQCDSVTLIAYIELTSSPSCPSSSFAPLKKIKACRWVYSFFCRNAGFGSVCPRPQPTEGFLAYAGIYYIRVCSLCIPINIKLHQRSLRVRQIVATEPSLHRPRVASPPQKI